jgi:hypothetical protein
MPSVGLMMSLALPDREGAVRRGLKPLLAAALLAVATAGPAPAEPLDRVGQAASGAWRALTGFTPGHANGIILYAGRVGPGPYGGPLQGGVVGEVADNDRWRCGATVGGARLYSTGFTETAAREKLLPYTSAYFRCQRRDRSSVFE